MNIYILIYPCNINWNIYWGQQQVVTWFNSILNFVKADISGASIDVQKDINERWIIEKKYRYQTLDHVIA